MTGIAAAILAGGKNTRMNGVNKAFVQINGIAIIERTIGLLKEIFDEIILVTNSPQEFNLYKEQAVITEDIIKDIGPLGGIHSALSITSKQAVFFAACDMPFLHNGFIQEQIGCFQSLHCDCLVPKIGDLIEPLHAVYKQKLADDILRFVCGSSDYSIRSFLKTVNVRYWDGQDTSFHRDIFRNVNTEEDVRAIEGKIKGLVREGRRACFWVRKGRYPKGGC